MTTTPAKVSRPLPISETSQPYRGVGGRTTIDLTEVGYVEEEYLVSGEFDGMPYTTTLLVRRPSDEGRFSGVVFVASLHAFGAPSEWGELRATLFRHGHGYAMICSQRSPLERYVKPSDPTRYESLEIKTKGSAPNVDTTDILGGDRDAWRKAQEQITQYDNPASHRIVSQVGALLRSNAGDSPLSGVRYLIYGGASNTGMLTADYMAVEHHQAYMPDGSPVYAGYWPANNHSQIVVPPDAAVVHVVAEGDIRPPALRPRAFAVAPPREDSDAAQERFRRYEIAGAAHSTSRGLTSFVEAFPSVFGAPGVHFEGSPSQFPTPTIKGALFDLLVRWVTDGRTPPRAERIFVDGEGIIRRDEWGNALGGVRSTYLDVPVKTYHAWAGSTYPQTEIGSEVTLAPEVLRKLYSSKEDYVHKVDARLDQLVAQGWFPAEEVDVIRQEAAAVDIPG